MLHSTYYGRNIYRNGSARFFGMRLPWETYLGDRFAYADTLDGIRELIREDRRRRGLTARR